MGSLGRALLHTLVVMAIALVACWPFRSEIVGWLVVPTGLALIADGRQWLTQGMPSPFWYWPGLVLAALTLASPWGAYNVWRSLVRAVDRRERRFATSFVAISLAGAVCSALLARSVLAPALVEPVLSEYLRGRHAWVEDLIVSVCTVIVTAIALSQVPIVVALLVASRRLSRAG